MGKGGVCDLGRTEETLVRAVDHPGVEAQIHMAHRRLRKDLVSTPVPTESPRDRDPTVGWWAPA